MNERDDTQTCGLSPEDEPACGAAAVVAVEDRRQDVVWGCEPHAAAALNGIEGARIARVTDWSVARRLLALPWNHRIDGLAR